MKLVFTKDENNTYEDVINFNILKDANEYKNNEAAVSAGAEIGSVYKLPYNVKKDVQLLAIVKDNTPIDPPLTSFILTLENQATAPYLRVTLDATESTSLTVDWGDGDVETISNETTFDLMHQYENVGLFNVTITAIDFALIDRVKVNESCVTNIQGIMLFNNLATLVVNDNLLTTFPSYLPNNLQTLVVKNNQLTSYTQYVKPKFIDFSGNKLTEYKALNNVCYLAEILILKNNFLPFLPKDLGLSEINCTRVDISDNAMNLQNLNDALVYLREFVAKQNAIFELNSQKFEVTTPTRYGALAKNELVNDFNCTVITD